MHTEDHFQITDLLVTQEQEQKSISLNNGGLCNGILIPTNVAFCLRLGKYYFAEPINNLKLPFNSYDI